MEYRKFCKSLGVQALISTLLLTACSVNPATGRKEFNGLMPASSEASIGASQHEAIVKEYGGLYYDRALQDYVTGIGQKLARNTERNDVTYQFFVLDSPVVNAFALPGGYVYVTRGLLAIANDEAELAGVIGHEIGHVTARHQAARYSQSVLANLGAGLLGAAVGNQALSQALGVGSNLYISSYSRDQESEADRLGIRYVSRAGYDPMAVSDFLAAMDQYQTAQSTIEGKGREQADIFATHPQTGGRVTAAAAEARNYQGVGTFRNGDMYLSKIDGMTFGDSPSQGYVRGQSFYHPELGFTFTVPNGYTIKNGADKIVAMNGKNSVILVDAARSSTPDPVSYISSEWLQGQKPVTPERININGRDAATVSMQGSLNGAPVEIRLVAISWGNGQMYRMQFAIPASGADIEGLKRTTYSFRALSQSEIAGLKPQRIRVVTAGPGDNVDTLSRQMNVDKAPVQQFRAINALHGGEGVSAGRKYKLIVR